MKKLIQEVKSKIKYISIIKVARLLLATFLLSALSSCDFTPRIHQKILVAQNHITNQEYEKAVKQYENILEQAPIDDIKIKIYFQLGELYAVSLGKYRKGINYYEKIRTLSTEPLWLVKSQERVGEISYNYLRDYKKSEEVYKELTTFRPRLVNYPIYEYRYATSLLKRKKYQEAEKIIKNIQTNVAGEFFVESFYEMGILKMEIKDWDKSIYFFKQYIKREKRRDRVVNAKFLLANIYEVVEKLKTAYNIYYSILGEYPNTEVIQQRLKNVYDRRVSRRR